MARLLNINNYHYRRGGSDVVYLEHAALMQESGLESGYFSMAHPENLETPWARYFVKEIEFGHNYSLARKVSMASNVIYSLEARRKLRMLLSAFPADIAHLHCIYHHLSPSIIPVLSEAGIPVVLTAHDLKLACPAYKMLSENKICERCKGGGLYNLVTHRCIKDSLVVSTVVALEAYLHRFLDTYRKHVTKVVVPSMFFTQKFMEWGWPEDKFIYIPNYVDSARYIPDFNPGNYFLYFGRLAPEKGLVTLMRAAKDARVTLKIAGTGPEDVRLRNLCQSLDADIEFLGYRSGEELRSLIREARAVVLPSEWYENAPMSVLESFASGKPVIGANIGGIPEMVKHGFNGFLFDSGSGTQLASVLGNVAHMQDDKLAGLGKAARRMVETKFDRKTYVDSMLMLYDSLGVKPS